MEFHMMVDGDPLRFIARDLGENFYLINTGSLKSPKEDEVSDKDLFKMVFDQFNCISISSGVPRDEGGQTIHLSHVKDPDLSDMEWMEIPPYLISESMPFSPSEMSNRYAYRTICKPGDHVQTVEEVFFFKFQTGYRPETFWKLNASLSALRHLSSILHGLDLFKIVLTPTGVYVALRARINDYYKPQFRMNG